MPESLSILVKHSINTSICLHLINMLTTITQGQLKFCPRFLHIIKQYAEMGFTIFKPKLISMPGIIMFFLYKCVQTWNIKLIGYTALMRYTEFTSLPQARYNIIVKPI